MEVEEAAGEDKHLDVVSKNDHQYHQRALYKYSFLYNLLISPVKVMPWSSQHLTIYPTHAIDLHP